MDNGMLIVIGMSTTTVVSAIMQGIFSSLGKQNESQYVDLATKCLLAGTSITAFIKLISTLKGLS